MRPEEDYEANCPYCTAPVSIRVDHTAGSRQTFVTDCENCCRPMEVEVETQADGDDHIIVKREGEG